MVKMFFRDSFGLALDEITGIPSSSSSSTKSGTVVVAVAAAVKNHDKEFIIVDFGCGTGMSTRWLARRYSQATKILGLDLSPYFIEVGKRFLDLATSTT
jgi:trans-aconitate methyltransferase